MEHLGNKASPPSIIHRGHSSPYIVISQLGLKYQSFTIDFLPKTDKKHITNFLTEFYQFFVSENHSKRTKNNITIITIINLRARSHRPFPLRKPWPRPLWPPAVAGSSVGLGQPTARLRAAHAPDVPSPACGGLRWFTIGKPWENGGLVGFNGDLPSGSLI